MEVPCSHRLVPSQPWAGAPGGSHRHQGENLCLDSGQGFSVKTKRGALRSTISLGGGFKDDGGPGRSSLQEGLGPSGQEGDSTSQLCPWITEAFLWFL